MKKVLRHFFCMTSHLINNMRALARAHGETFDFLLENQAVLVQNCYQGFFTNPTGNFEVMYVFTDRHVHECKNQWPSCCGVTQKNSCS